MPPIRHLLLSPLYGLSILTGAKNFARNPVIGSPTLNRLGLHRWRLLAASRLGRWRSRWLRHGVDPELAQHFDQQGYCVLPDLLTEARASTIRQEIRQIKGDARRMIQGDCWTDRILLTPSRLRRMPILARLLARSDLKHLFAFTATKRHTPLFYIQRIHHLPNRPADPQKTLHSDTFHPTMKAWLFLEAVTPDHGPFTYVPGSHAYRAQRAAYETQVALSHKSRNEPYSGRGSIRVDATALGAMGLGQPVSLSCRAGTLVVANTHGFHGRGSAIPGATRLEIFVYSRVSPFLPLPFGIPDPLGLSAVFLDLWQRLADWRAARNGRYPIWRRLPLADMLEPPQPDQQEQRHD